MRQDVAQDLSESAENFKQVVWPRIKDDIGGGYIEPVESVMNEGMTKELDILAGIDAWQVINKKGIRGIASRVQYGRAWDTFTIRYSRPSGAKTEYQKRVDQLTDGSFLLPEYTIQAYLDKQIGGSFASAGIIQTTQLYYAAWSVINNPENYFRREDYGWRRSYSGEWFVWLSFDFLESEFEMIKLGQGRTS